MGSIKVLLRKKANKDNQFPLAIRITHNRKSSFLFLGQYIDEKHWDEANRKVKKSHPNSVRLNSLILTKLTEANNKLLELETETDRTSSSAVKDQLKSKYKQRSFFKLAETYLETLEKSGKYRRHLSDKSMIKHFQEFTGGDIDFRDITEIKLRQFQAYLRSNRNVTERTVVNHLVVIRTLFNLAIRGQIVDRKFYPFGKGKIVVKFPQSVKIGLEVEEVQRLENFVDSLGKAQRHALNIWLLSFYFAGMRVSDVLRLKWSDFQNGRLFYSMGKNKKAGSLKVPDKADTILNYYESQRDKTDLVFNELRKADLNNSVETAILIANADKKFNTHLKKVAAQVHLNKPLTMHIARHTFGNLSGDNIPIQMLQKLYRHTSINTTINYQANFINKETDEALDSVINFN